MKYLTTLKNPPFIKTSIIMATKAIMAMKVKAFNEAPTGLSEKMIKYEILAFLFNAKYEKTPVSAITDNSGSIKVGFKRYFSSKILTT
jgi:hypothetical protein